MNRKLLHNLKQWYQSNSDAGHKAAQHRKPLVIRGARQVGKTWLVREFARQESLDLCEFNFERDPSVSKLFEPNDPSQIIGNLQQYLSRRLDVRKLLLFLDEIQAVPHLLAKLRWFAEERPDIAVIAAGSLLDFALKGSRFSMPVGRISYLYLEPMSFIEFLDATGHSLLTEMLNNYDLNHPIAKPVHQKLINLQRVFRQTGGMPAIVNAYCKSTTAPSQSLSKITDYVDEDCRQLQHNLLVTFRDDFHKYSGKLSHDRLTQVLDSVSYQLGQKFKYSRINKDEASSGYKRALDLLCEARLCHRIYASSSNRLPLAGEIRDRYFKVFVTDIGLLSTLLGEGETSASSHSNEGAVSEQLVAQLLRCTFPKYIDPQLFYWVRERRGSEAEVDFVIAIDGQIIPIEVKSGKTGRLRSLHSFVSTKRIQDSGEHSRAQHALSSKLAVRINADLPSLTDVPLIDMSDNKNTKQTRSIFQLLSIPFYLVEQLPRLVRQVLNR